jgi:hypothetical protein
MANDEYDALQFGKVLATLEAQNRVLAEMHEDIEKLFSMIHQMQQAESQRCRESKEKKSAGEWGREIIIAILGAVAYFVFDSLMHGAGK